MESVKVPGPHNPMWLVAASPRLFGLMENLYPPDDVALLSIFSFINYLLADSPGRFSVSHFASTLLVHMGG